MHKNGHRIVTQQGGKFAFDWSNWTTLDNISQMYFVFYDVMVDANIAEKIDESVFMKQKGKVVEKCNQFGNKVDRRLTQPDYCLFADDTRCNTSMKKMVLLLEPDI